MYENLNSRGTSDLESEIALLSKQIEEKRSQLESQRNVVEEINEKEIIKGVIKSHSDQGGDLPDQFIPHSSGGKNDTDELSAEDEEIVASLTREIEHKGIFPTLHKAKTYPPFVLDAFHDRLVDHLYEVLKARGIIK